MENKSYGIIGLGKMGANLAMQAAGKGYTIVGYDKHLPTDIEQENLILAHSVNSLVDKLPTPRRIFIYIPAGVGIDNLIDDLSPLLDPGDIIIDGGNSYWGDSIRRAERLKKKGLYFIDCGTSGGVSGARNGACFMIGGETEAVKEIEPLLKDLAVPEGYIHTGAPGSGHFVKLVHNGIEFGMLQAIGEGMALLGKYREELDVSGILKTWNNGSVVRSWLIELMKNIYDEKQGFNVPSYVEDTGEVNWLVTDAMHMDVSVPVIASSVMQLIASRDSDNLSSKAIAMMRNGFGGHPFGTDDGIRHERNFGKVGGYQPAKGD
ncbi:6-phosphogluconate dehydrogenase [Arcticibacter tournemirensis]|uniref:Decarboxylating 6-phosphogluconate dehydrogenase n=1 Tax=Arcticibacter tournemirensis TaxID=699437 RepID=A0A5M9GKH9_9SPHI|nr:decarboxylating 6-phosphogluconate dehydrogenase [Arcticibacter tournemirensis]KAA8475192.1 decarboxylating 6-phosphogluconate dehydrogenase [Arcticibacter tournemirensis]TQM52417.1 6-phosphogluconate dehydrogenase [Arcticibacter tournemirensis]